MDKEQLHEVTQLAISIRCKGQGNQQVKILGPCRNGSLKDCHQLKESSKHAPKFACYKVVHGSPAVIYYALIVELT